MQRVSRCLTAIGLFSIVLLGGCGDGMATVGGNVTLDGKPLHTGAVSFHPTGGGPVGIGEIDAEGNYTIRTASKDGLAPGNYRVTIVATGEVPEPEPGDLEPIPERLTPERYGDVKTSGFEFKVESSGGKFPLPLTSAEN